MRVAVVGLVLPVAACVPEEGPPADPCASPGAICTVLGIGGSLGFNGDGLTATETMLYWPTAVRFDPLGHLVVSDLNNFRVRRVEEDGTVGTILGTGFHLGSTEGVPATTSPVDFPIDFRFAADGTFYVLASHEARVLWVDDATIVHWIVGDGNYGYTGDGSDAKSAQLSEPAGLARADDGTLYVADTQNHCIRKVDPQGFISTLAGRGFAGFAGDGGPAEAALMNAPTGLTLDGSRLYVSDAGNHAIRVVDLATDTIERVAGNGAQGWSGDGGDALDATLSTPEAVAVDPEGRVWIADAGNNVLRRIDTDGTIATLAGTGEAGFAGDEGPAADATFSWPVDLQFDAAGDLYVADMVNGAVRVIRGAGAL
jgi:sugar lactone lactonase YvrE